MQAVDAAVEEVPIKGNIVDFRDAGLSCSFPQQYAFATTAKKQHTFE